MNPYQWIIANTAHVKMQLSASNYSIRPEVFHRLPCLVLHCTYGCTLRWPAIRSIQATTICPLHTSIHCIIHAKPTCTLESTHKHCNYVQAWGSVWRYFDKQVTADQPLSSQERSTDKEHSPLSNRLSMGYINTKYTLERAALRSSSKSIN